MNRENILRYLKIKGEPDALTSALIEECTELAVKISHPQRIYNLYEVQAEKTGVLLGETFFEGEKIKERLQEVRLCAVFAATLGIQADLLLKKYTISDPAKAVVLQAVLADYTEDICDLTENEIKRAVPGYSLQKRFSPGYPGLPLDYQKNIFSMLDISKRIGIDLTQSYMMIPSKSVTAFVGLKKDDYDE